MSASPPVAGSMARPRFVGRGQELATLTEVAARVVTGEPAAVLVAGEAGVGKTRLWEEAALALDADGWLILSGQCAQPGAEGSPLAPLVDALRCLARAIPAEELSVLLGSARSEFARLLPQLDEDQPRLPGTATSSSQLLELVLGLLGRLSARQPVAFVVEDLHWADPSTLDLLAFLVRALRHVPVLLVMTYRSDELHRRHPLRPLLAQWERVRTVSRLPLSRFDRDEVSLVLGGLLPAKPTAGLVDAVYDRSAGNAFLVEEIADVVRSGGDPDDLPPSLRDVLLNRLDLLSEPAQRVVRIVAVAGRWAPDRMLAAVAGLTRPELFAALHEAVDHSLLVVDPSGRGYAFRHALARDVIYEDMLPGERVSLHQTYGEVLSAAPDLLDPSVSLAALTAHHWYAAFDLPRALPALVQAAQQAMATFAPAEAQQHLERALEIWRQVPDAQTRTGLDHVELLSLAAGAALAGGVHRALALLDQALSELPVGADPARRALLMERRARATRDLGRDAEGIAILREALDLLPEEPASRAHAVVLASLAVAQLRVADLRAATDTAERAVTVAARVGADQQEADARISLGHLQVSTGASEPGLASIRTGLDSARRMGQPETALRGYINLSDTQETLGRHAEAIKTATEGAAYAAEVGFARSLGAYLSGNLADPLLRLGRWSEAEQVIVEALGTEPEGAFAATLIDLQAELAVLAGRYDEALRHVALARRLIGPLADDQFTAPLVFVEAEAARAAGDLSRAAAVIAPATSAGVVRAEAWSGRYLWPLVWLATRIQVEQTQQARDTRQPAPPTQRADDLAELALSLPTRTAPAQGYRALTLAELSRVASVPDPEAWSAAASRWRSTGEPYLLAYCLVRLGEACCVAGDRTAAATAVQEAHALAAAMGAAPLQTEVESLAHRARLPLGSVAAAEEAPEVAPGADDQLQRWGLTDREREVLLLVAQGRTNAQIADTLFISPKTVSVHVSNILAKLGVSSRVQAAGLAHRLGLVSASQDSGSEREQR